MASRTETEEALSDFVDILNEHGPDSVQAKEFRKQAQNPKLMELMDKAIEIHYEFHPKLKPN